MRRFIALALALAIMTTGLLSAAGTVEAAAPGNVLLPELAVHGRVVVNGPSDFTAQGFSGSGSVLDPYVLDSVVIDAAGAGSGIIIANTTSSYFEIRNVMVTNAVLSSPDPFHSGAGIVLYHAEKGTVYNCAIIGNSIGVGIYAGGDIKVSQCAFNNDGNGVWIFNTQGTLDADPVNIELYRNYFNGVFGGYPVYAASTSWLTIDGNDFRLAIASQAVLLTNCSTNVLIEDNNFQGFSGRPITLAGCDNTTVRNNDLSATTGDPITIVGSASHPAPINNLIITDNDCTGTSQYGIKVDPGATPFTGSTISNNLFSGHQIGIYALLDPTSHSITIERNVCNDLLAGMSLTNFQKGVIRYNTCTGNGAGGVDGYGIALYATSAVPSTGTVSNEISNNDLSSNRYPLWIGPDNNWNVITANDCSYGLINIHIESSYNTISYNTIYNSVPSGRNVFGVDVGIQLSGAQASYNTIIGNTISIPIDRTWGASETSTGVGIEITGGVATKATNNVVSYNQLLFCTVDGISLDRADSTELIANTVMGTGNGIDLLDSDLNQIVGNNIYPFADAMTNGIVLTTSSSNTISQNLISGLSGIGITLRTTSELNIVTENWLSNNNGYGVWVGASTGNRIFLNAFDNNRGGSTQAYSTEDLNVNSWSSGAATDQGNYWSDHSSPDTGFNGYVDTPYSIGGPGTEEDPAPLTFVVGPVLNLASDTGYETVQLTWTVPAYSTYAPATEYVIYRDGSGTPYAILPAGATVFYDTAVLPGDSHTYKVCAAILGQENPISPSIVVNVPTIVGPNPMTFTINPVSAIQTTSSVTVTWTPTDTPASTYWLSIDNFITAVSTTDVTYTFTGLTDSPFGEPYTLYIKAENGGAFETKLVQFTVDITAPSIISNLGYQNIFGSGSVPFYYYIWDTGAGIINDTVYLDGVQILNHNFAATTYVDYGIPVAIDLGSPTALTGGTHQIIIYSQDGAGNLRTTIYTFLIDDVAPLLSLTSDVQISGNTNKPETTFSWFYSYDPVFPNQALKYQVRYDGSDWQDVGTAKKFVTPTLPDGLHTFWLKGIDMGGHETIVSLIFYLDSVGPVVTSSSPASGSTLIDGSVNLAWTATDGDGLGIVTHMYQLDNQMVQYITSSAGSQSVTLTGITTGSHVIRIWAVDAAGNIGPSKVITFTMDGNPPVTTAIVTGTAGTNGWYTSAVSVQLSATDVGSGVAATYYRFGTDPAWTTYTTPIPISAEGPTALHFYSVDNFGSVEAPHTVIILIDTVAPTTTATLAGNLGSNGWYSTPVTVNLTATDATSLVNITQYNIDSTGWVTYTGNFTVTAEGPHVVAYRSVDLAGNVEADQTVSFKISTSGPTTTASYTGATGLNGWNTSAVTVTLSATDPTANILYIMYRVNGGGWTQYVSAILLSSEGVNTLEFNATNNAGLVEATKTLTFYIDTVAPATQANLQGTTGNSGWYSTPVVISLNAIDPTSGVGLTQYNLDSAGWSTYYSSLTVIASGNHTFAYRSVDVAGNVEAEKWSNFSIDTVAPVTTYHLSGDLGLNGWNTTDVTVTLSATDDASGVWNITYRVNGGAWTTYTAPFVITSEWIDIVEFYGTDNAGNVEAVKSFTIKIDKSAPITAVYLTGTIGTSGWYKSAVTIALLSFDPYSGVGSTWYRLDGIGGFLPYGGAVMVIGEGAHQFEYYSVDLAGNVEAIKWANFSIDTVAPETVAEISGTIGDNGWYTTDVTVVLNSTDAVSGVSYTVYRINAGDWRIYSQPLQLTGETTYIIEFRAVDVAGNDEAAKSVTIKIDKTAPITDVSLDGTAGTVGWYLSNVSATLIPVDPVSGLASTWYRVDGVGAFLLYSGMFNITGEGSHTVEYYSVDLAGNVEIVKWANFSIDTVLPSTSYEVSGTTGTNGWYVSNIGLTLIANDATSGIATTYYRLNSGGWTAYAGPITLSDEGVVTVEFYSVDIAGNVEPIGTVTFSIDKTVPSTDILVDGTPGTTSWYRSNISVTLQAVDAISGVAETWYRIDGTGAFLAYSAAFNIEGDGAHTLEYYSVDIAGNAEAVKWFNFSIDLTAPVTTASYNGAIGLNGWNTSAVTVTLSATDGVSGVASIMYRINGAGWTAYSTPIVLDADGLYTVEFYAVDVAGNVEVAQTLAFKIDKTAPITGIALEGTTGLDGWNTSAVTVNLNPFDAQSGVAATYYRLIADGTFVEYTAPVVLSVDGIYTIEYYTVDVAGNAEQSKFLTIKVDATSPTLEITAPGEGTYHNTSIVAVAWIGNDAESGVSQYMLMLDDGNWFTLSSALDRFIFDLVDGYHTVSVKAQDVAGNTMVRMVNFTVDTVPPEVATHSPQGYEELRNVTIEVEFSEIMDEASIYITVNGVPGTISRTSTTAVFTPANLLEYNTTFTVTVGGRDLARNAVVFSWTFATKAGIGTLTGVLVNEEGKPIANAVVQLAGGPGTTTDSDGRYWLNATQGYYTLFISAPEMVNATVGVFIAPDQTANIGTMTMSEVNEWQEHFLIWLGLVVALVIIMVIVAIYLKRRRRA